MSLVTSRIGWGAVQCAGSVLLRANGAGKPKRAHDKPKRAHDKLHRARNVPRRVMTAQEKTMCPNLCAPIAHRVFHASAVPAACLRIGVGSQQFRYPPIRASAVSHVQAPAHQRSFSSCQRPSVHRIRALHQACRNSRVYLREYSVLQE